MTAAADEKRYLQKREMQNCIITRENNNKLEIISHSDKRLRIGEATLTISKNTREPES
jgi:hypothetical protein